jgi:phosphohistidine phosphatase SixA
LRAFRTATVPRGAAAQEDQWRALAAPGHVALMRHALTTPGVGDPPGFRLGDCTTQRNLSQEGRAAAVRLGEAYRSRAVRVARILSSEWCRCLDTARLMDLVPG